MNIVEPISNKTIVPVGEAIEILTQVLMQAHHMNPEDKLEKVRHAKIKYVKSQIISLVESGKVEGNVEFYDCEHEGVDGVTSECDRFVNELPHKLDINVSSARVIFQCLRQVYFPV